MNQIERGLWANRMQFFVLGALMGHFGAHVASIKQVHQLSDGQLGQALLASACGSAVCLLTAGTLVQRWGARRCLMGAVAATGLSLSGLLLAPNVALLLALMAAFGAATSLLDVATNAEGCDIEARAGRKLLSGLHGMFSVGGMAGALWAALLLQLAVPPAWQVAGTAAALVMLNLGASRYMVSAASHGDANEARWRLPRGSLLVLGLLAAAGLLAEGAMYDWTVVYLRDALGTSGAVAALGYASFCGAMAAGRFGGDALRTRFHPAVLLRASGALAAVAMAVVLLIGHPLATVLGFAVVGLGLANVIPLLFIEASQQPGSTPAGAIAAVTSVSFLGFVSGPPLVGALAQASSLRLALGVIVAAAVAVALGARALRH